MIEFRAFDSSLIEVKTSTEYDYNMDPAPMGPNKMIVEVQPGYQLTQMQTDFQMLKGEFDRIKFDMEEMLAREKAEAQLRKDYPTLQDVWEQYQMVKHLVEDAKKPIEKDDGTN